MKNGILTPLVTPLFDDEHLDTASLRRLVDHVIEGGVSGIFLLGTTGEGPNLSEALRREVLERAAECINGRVPLLVNVTGTSFTDNIALASAAKELGATAAVYAGPLYCTISQSDLLAHLGRLAARCPLPLFLYNMPSHTNIAFDVATVARLQASGDIIGLKDSSAKLMYLQDLRCTLGPDFPLFIGPEELLYPAMISAGVNGGVNGGSNLFPHIYVGIHDAVRAGDHAEAARLHAVALSVSQQVYRYGYLRGLKAALQAAELSETRELTEPGLALEAEFAETITEFVQPLRVQTAV